MNANCDTSLYYLSKFNQFGLVYYTKLNHRMSIVLSVKFKTFNIRQINKPKLYDKKSNLGLFVILENLRILIQYLVYSLGFLI